MFSDRICKGVSLVLFIILLIPSIVNALDKNNVLIVTRDGASTSELGLVDRLEETITEKDSSISIETKPISQVDGLNLETLTFVIYKTDMKIIIKNQTQVSLGSKGASVLQLEGVKSQIIWDFEVKSSNLEELFIPLKKEICVDSDNGKNYFVKGQARIGDRKEYSEDECYGDRLDEAYCNEMGGTSSDYHFCEFGCEDGVCLKSSKEPRPHSIYLIQEPIGEFLLSRFNTVEIEGKTQIEGQYKGNSIYVDVWILFPVEELDTSGLEKITFGEDEIYYKDYNDMRGTEKVYKWISENKRISINTYGGGLEVNISSVVKEYLDKYPIKKIEPETKSFIQKFIDWFLKIINWFKNLFG